MNRRTVAAGVGLSAVSLVGGQAIATPAWQPVHVVATAGHGGVFGPLVVANARGDAAAAWVDRSSKRLRVAQRPAQHQWRSAVNVSAAHLSADDQQAAIDARNDMVVAWDAFDGQHELLQAAFHRAGHAWNRPITLARLAQGNPARPQVAMNAEGAVTIVWGAGTGSARRLQVVRRTAAGHWSGKVRLPGTGQSTLDPGVAMDGLGNAVVVWQRVLYSTTSTIQVTRR